MPKQPVIIHYEERVNLRTVEGPIIYIGKKNRGANEDNPLIFAAENIHDNWEAVEALLESGARVNRREPEHGRTPLQHAAAKGNLNIAKLLLESGATVNLKDKHGKNALHDAVVVEYPTRNFAAYKKRVSLVKLLLEYRIDVNTKPDIGSTPLMEAVVRAKSDMVKALLEAGANARTKDKGFPVLYVALARMTKYKDLMINTIKELIKAGASIFEKHRGKNFIELLGELPIRPTRKRKLTVEVIRTVILKKYPEQMDFMDFNTILTETCRLVGDCYNEVELMNSIYLKGQAKLRNFALKGSKDWKVYDAAISILMRQTFENYNKFILDQLPRSHLRDTIVALGIYTRTDRGDTVYETFRIRALCEYLPKGDLVNLIEVLVKSRPAI